MVFHQICADDLVDCARSRSNTGPRVGALLGNRACDGGAFELTLWVHNDTSIVLEVHEVSVLAAEGLALADDDSWHHFLTQLRSALLHGCHHHVASAGSWQPVQDTTIALDRHDVQVLGSSVVGTVHDRRNRKTKSHTKLVTTGATTGCTTRLAQTLTYVIRHHTLAHADLLSGMISRLRHKL